MSRESEEQNAKNQYDDNFARGAGDPDFYGYPGEPQPKVGPLIQDIRPASEIMKAALADRPF